MTAQDELLTQVYPQQIAYLQKLLHSGKMHHAYTFVGVAQGGQNALATYFATLLLGSQYALAQHPDFLRVAVQEGKATLGVEEAKTVRDHLLRKPQLAAYRVVLIESVDCLTIAAANALLKMLEEPPASGMIVCTTAAQQQLPATVRSRMQFVHLSAISSLQTAHILQQSGTALANIQESCEVVQGKFERLLALCAHDADSLFEERLFWHAFLCASTAERDQTIGRYVGTGDHAQLAAHTITHVLDVMESLLHVALESRAQQEMRDSTSHQLSRWHLPQYSLMELSHHLVALHRIKEMATHNVQKKLLFDYLTFAL